MSFQKERARQIRVSYNKSLTGKTLEQIYGEEKASKIRLKKSEAAKGDNNPAYGKVYSNGGKSVKGRYKGFFFRSLLEYSFMKYQESLGREIGKDFRPYEIAIPYELEGRKRTYHPDFIVDPDNCIVEIKQSYALERPENIIKFKVGKKYANGVGKNYRVLSELDFSKILFDDALNDKEVVWDERTFEYFNNETRLD